MVFLGRSPWRRWRLACGFWSLAPFFASSWLLLAMAWGCWWWCGGELVPGISCLLRLYRRSCFSDPGGARGLLVRRPRLFFRPWWRGEERGCRLFCGVVFVLLRPAEVAREEGVFKTCFLRRLRRAVVLRAGVDGREVVAGRRHRGRARSLCFSSVACGGRHLRSSTCVGCPFSRGWRRPGAFFSGGGRRRRSSPGVAAVQRRLLELLLFWASSACMSV